MSPLLYFALGESTSIFCTCFRQFSRFLILREPSTTPGLAAQAKDKENEAPYGSDPVDPIKASSSLVIKSKNASYAAANEYAGNTWEKYFMATVEEPGSSGESPIGVGQAGGDKYSAIALLDDDQEEEKWSERTAVITALDHQVSNMMKPNCLKYL